MNDKKIILIILALSPFLIGNIHNYQNNTLSSVVILINVFFLIYWFFVGFISTKLTESTIQSILIGNSFGILSIAILLISGIFFEKYLSGFIGMQLQMYFLPAIMPSSLIISNVFNNIGVNLIFFVSFLLMIVVYIAGYFVGLKKFKSTS